MLLTVLAILVALASGCDLALGNYNGPISEAPLTAEVVEVGYVGDGGDAFTLLMVDRERHAREDPRSPDRVVVLEVEGPAPRPFAVGDRLLVTTEFLYVRGVGGMRVPGWSLNRYWEPPAAFHRPVKLEAAP